MPKSVSQTPFIIHPPQDLLATQPALRRAARNLANAYANHQFASEAMLKAMGSGLWQAVGDADALAQARQRAGNRILPIIVESSEADIQQLPWETLHHPEHSNSRTTGARLLLNLAPSQSGWI